MPKARSSRPSLKMLGPRRIRCVSPIPTLVRVLEDLIEMLTAKGIILFTELPESAQQKILLRKRLRKDRTNSLDLLGED